MQNNFSQQHRTKIFIALLIGAVIYLAIHYYIFDKDFRYQGLKVFIKEGGRHIFHVAPVVIAFVGFLLKDQWDRRKTRKRAQVE